MILFSYASTNQRLIGKFRVKKHARDRFKQRKGEQYIGNKKIKNMGRHKLNRKIIKSIRERTVKVVDQLEERDSLLVITKDFKAVVVPGFYNHVVTIL